MVVLNTVEEAINYLAQLDDGTEPDEVVFEEELATLHIEVDGDRYHATIPGELARGLWQFQEAVYSAAAYALTKCAASPVQVSRLRSSLEAKPPDLGGEG